MESRKNDFKKSPHPYDLRNKRRSANNELRKDKRSEVVRRKRRTLSESANNELTVHQVKSAVEGLKKDKTTTIENLKLLRNAFAQGSALVDAFLEVDGSMQCLVGVLTSSDAEAQLLAEWCLTNMAAGTEEHAQVVLKAAGSYLITFLSSPSTPLQDQSAWTLGNVACGEEECSQLLAMGILPSLLALLESSCDKVLKSCTFALSNMARNDSAKKQLTEAGVVQRLLVVLDGSHANDLDLLIEVTWLLTYLAACKESCGRMVEEGVLQRLLKIFNHYSLLTPLNVQLLTPVGRCLGNLFCEVGEALMGTSVDPQLLSGLQHLLDSPLVHLNKEALWVLSNMAVFKHQTEAMMERGMHNSIISLLSAAYNVSFEAVCCLGNMSIHGDEVCTKLFEGGCLQKLVPLLSYHDLPLVQASLHLLRTLLSLTQHKGALVFEEHKGLTALELLEYHNNPNIAQLTNEILEKHIYVYQDQ